MRDVGTAWSPLPARAKTTVSSSPTPKTLAVDMAETERLRRLPWRPRPPRRQLRPVMRTKYRLGIDAGGTFTDLVLADRSGDVRLYKALSTPADPTAPSKTASRLMAEDLGESPAEIVLELRPLHQRHDGRPQCADPAQRRQNRLDLHRRPRGTRSRSGSATRKTAIRYDPEYPAATCWCRATCARACASASFRMGRSAHADGTKTDVRVACALFLKEGVETVAISFVWSVLNPGHERRAAEIVREMMPHAS